MSAAAVDVWAKALGHPVRRSIVRQLGACEQLSPSELAAVVDMAVPSVAYHVRLLNELGVIRLVAQTQARGRLRNHYTLVDREAAAVELARRTGHGGLSDLGAVFRRTRESRHVPVSTLAEWVSIDAKQLERIEAGKVDPSVQLLAALARALGCTIEAVLAEVE